MHFSNKTWWKSGNLAIYFRKILLDPAGFGFFWSHRWILKPTKRYFLTMVRWNCDQPPDSKQKGLEKNCILNQLYPTQIATPPYPFGLQLHDITLQKSALWQSAYAFVQMATVWVLVLHFQWEIYGHPLGAGIGEEFLHVIVTNPLFTSAEGNCKTTIYKSQRLQYEQKNTCLKLVLIWSR